MIYMSLIHSYLNYCNIIWGSTSSNYLQPLIVLQKKAVRLISHARFREESAPLFYNLKILPLHKIYHLNCLQFMFKNLNRNSFPFLSHRIIYSSSIHNHETRFNDKLQPIYERLSLCKNSYLANSVCLWNDLDLSIKHLKSLHYFKYKVKQHMLESLRVLFN